jgi:hypothetical protein
MTPPPDSLTGIRRPSCVCPYALGVHQNIRCGLIERISLGNILSLCGSQYEGCYEYHSLQHPDNATLPLC